ncbi:MAG: hypothetical protein U9R51_08435, partial [Actinomycetota bacterium]|nr:hypothetical protein [Actinomycetota bacterium]
GTATARVGRPELELSTDPAGPSRVNLSDQRGLGSSRNPGSFDGSTARWFEHAGFPQRGDEVLPCIGGRAVGGRLFEEMGDVGGRE